MNDPELEELAGLWREPDGADEAALVELARKAPRKARLLAYGDAAWLVLVGGSVIVTTWLHPNMLSISAAIVTLALIVWLNWRRRKLRNMSGSLVTRDRSAFLAGTIRIIQNDLRRVTFSLVTLPPGLLLAILFRVTTKDPSDPLGAIATWATSPRGAVALIVLSGLVFFTFRSRLRLSTQLKGLKELQKAYAEEARRDEQEAA